MNTRKIIVSVCMVTYAHEEFIAQAIDSIISQKTDFLFELVIGEDCGNDRTREICIEYQAKYPELIKLNLQTKNIGAQNNLVDTLSKCQGKYIAFCEGDDYWIDSYKLQKQVDFMEKNPDFVLCGHAAKRTYDNKNFETISLNKSILVLNDILEGDWGIMSASILFRRAAFDIPCWYTLVKNGDMALQLLMALKGKFMVLDEPMSVYRIHPGGMSATLKPLNQAAWLTLLLYYYNKHTHGEYKKLIKKRIERMFKNQIGFAKEYHLRKQAVVLCLFSSIKSLFPFAIRHLRK